MSGQCFGSEGAKRSVEEVREEDESSISDISVRCPKWRIRLLNEDDLPQTGKRFSMLSPHRREGRLDGSGYSEIYEEIAPSSSDVIRLDFPEYKVLPNFEALWGAFPNLEWKGVADLIGGAIEAEALEYNRKTGAAYNACTLRISRAFNYSGSYTEGFGIRHIQKEANALIKDDDGHAVPSGAIGINLRRLLGADGKAYAMRVSEFGPYLDKYYKDSAVTQTLKQELLPFLGFVGVMQININWSDATGHFALWDGTNFRRKEDNYIEHPGSGTYRSAKLFHAMEIAFLRKETGDGICTFVYQFRKRKNA